MLIIFPVLKSTLPDINIAISGYLFIYLLLSVIIVYICLAGCISQAKKDIHEKYIFFLWFLFRALINWDNYSQFSVQDLPQYCISALQGAHVAPKLQMGSHFLSMQASANMLHSLLSPILGPHRLVLCPEYQAPVSTVATAPTTLLSASWTLSGSLCAMLACEKILEGYMSSISHPHLPPLLSPLELQQCSLI